ncbi:MAG: TlpA disulfide reductase family protein [Bryobacteraceae bacterium]|jgi:peroxiredoxin
MIAMHSLLLLVLLQAAPAASAVESLYSGCSVDDQQITSIGAGDRVHVEMALAGESQTCYKVTLIRHGENLTGYVWGESLPAVADFVRRREKASVEAAEFEGRRAREVQPKAAISGEPVRATDPLVSSQFDDFSAKDVNGKPISLSGLKGRATIVTFWSPGNRLAVGQMESIMPLYNQFHGKGLVAVGVSMDPKASRVFEALDDVTLPFAQVPDQSGLAARYHVDPRAGKTFVLDANHRIVAAGPMGPDIIKAVRQLMDTPPPPTSAP